MQGKQNGMHEKKVSIDRYDIKIATTFNHMIDLPMVLNINSTQ